jgi:hypothetical protein
MERMDWDAPDRVVMALLVARIRFDEGSARTMWVAGTGARGDAGLWKAMPRL